MPYTAKAYTDNAQNREAQNPNDIEKQGKDTLKRVGDRLKFDIPKLADDEEYAKMTDYFANGPEGNELQKAQEVFISEDYNQIDSLSYGSVSFLCNKVFRNTLALFDENKISMDNAEFKEYAEENLNNPFFRLAMEMAGNTPDLTPPSLREAFGNISEQLNQLMMEKTVNPPTQEQKDNLVRELGKSGAKDALERNRVEQLSIAKMMFLSHFGTFHTVDNAGVNKPYTGSVTEAFAHGGRTFFCFGAGKDSEKMIENAVFHDSHSADGADRSSLVSRIAGTHGVESLGDKEGAGAFREVKTGGSTSGIHAMNPAIGGIGLQYGKKTMVNDGKSGHVFVKIQESTAEKGGYLMVGFEGEKSLSTGKTGHVHTPWAKKGKISSFGTGKGAPGAEIGGRVVDLSIWKPKQAKAIIDTFSEAYAKLQNDCANGIEGSAEKMAAINKKLTGKVMSREKFIDLMKNDLGIDKVSVSEKGVTETYELEQMMGLRDLNGAKNFEKMNSAADAFRKAQERGRDTKYTLGINVDELSDKLEAAKHIRFGQEKKDSDLMVNVKNSLKAVIELKNKEGGYSAEEMEKKLSQLKVDSAKYIKERSAKNERMKWVKEINKQVRGEIDAIADFRKKQKELTNPEPAPKVNNDLASI